MKVNFLYGYDVNFLHLENQIIQGVCVCVCVCVCYPPGVVMMYEPHGSYSTQHTGCTFFHWLTMNQGNLYWSNSDLVAYQDFFDFFI